MINNNFLFEKQSNILCLFITMSLSLMKLVIILKEHFGLKYCQLAEQNVTTH